MAANFLPGPLFWGIMQRKQFLKIMATATGTAALGTALQSLRDALPEQDERMPALFVGHGSPMNALEDNQFTQGWRQLATEMPRPKAILVVSAHWLTDGTHVTAMEKPQTIHDFGGFPKALFDAQYPAPGDPELAKSIAEEVKSTTVGLNQDWGLDHGAWSVTLPMYPKADIPVLQLSIDYAKPGEYHYALARELSSLRKKGILIIGSGNMVHNLRMVDFSKIDSDYGFDWAIEMNELFKKKILDGDHRPLLDHYSLGASARLAIPTPDHYYPLLYTLGLQEKGEAAEIFNDKAVAGSLTMTSVRIG